jgi:cytidine deaminase
VGGKHIGEKVSKEELIRLAKEARERAYAPYSRFKVGAALLTEDGKVFTGGNVENASYGLSICAERVAAVKAVSDGHTKFSRLVVVADTEEPCPPCGVCRQMLFEFAPDMPILMVTLRGKEKELTLRELLPEPFGDEVRK